MVLHSEGNSLPWFYNESPASPAPSWPVPGLVPVIRALGRLGEDQEVHAVEVRKPPTPRDSPCSSGPTWSNQRADVRNPRRGAQMQPKGGRQPPRPDDPPLIYTSLGLQMCNSLVHTARKAARTAHNAVAMHPCIEQATVPLPRCDATVGEVKAYACDATRARGQGSALPNTAPALAQALRRAHTPCTCRHLDSPHHATSHLPPLNARPHPPAPTWPLLRATLHPTHSSVPHTR